MPSNGALYHMMLLISLSASASSMLSLVSAIAYVVYVNFIVGTQASLITETKGSNTNVHDAELSVRNLYEMQPYPPRLHGYHLQGHKVLLECVPKLVFSTLRQLAESEYSIRRPFRILVAGAGCGDPTIACSHSFELEDIPVELVHLDLSSRSNAIAKLRAEHLLSQDLVAKLFYVRGSISRVAEAVKDIQNSEEEGIVDGLANTLLDIDNDKDFQTIHALFSKKFDFIHCTGVLHHSKEPRKSLLDLKSLLRDGGGIALWVYSSSGGRDGIQDFQRMMKILSPRSEEEIADTRLAWGSERNPTGVSSTNKLSARERLRRRHAERLEIAWDLLANLPESNRLVRNPVLWNSISGWLAQYSESLDELHHDAQSSELEEHTEPRWNVRMSDMFLNPVDREFSVRDVLDWLSSAGLEPAKWLDVDSGHFDLGFKAGSHLHRVVTALDEIDKLALGEMVQGTAVGHRLIIVPTAKQETGKKLRPPEKYSPKIVPPKLML